MVTVNKISATTPVFSLYPVILVISFSLPSSSPFIYVVVCQVSRSHQILHCKGDTTADRTEEEVGPLTLVASQILSCTPHWWNPTLLLHSICT